MPLVLIRWDETSPPAPYNLVLLLLAEANRIEREGAECLSEAMRISISQRLQWARETYASCWDEEQIYLANRQTVMRTNRALSREVEVDARGHLFGMMKSLLRVDLAVVGSMVLISKLRTRGS